MPFGLTNAPSTFQALMNDIFRPYLRRSVLVFFNDILVYSQDQFTHIHHLGMAFEVLKCNSLWVNYNKCCFGALQLEYLGNVISAGGIIADSTKVEAMMQWPVPKDIRSLQGFAGYYQRFVKSYWVIAKPLTQLLKKNCFKWGDEAQKKLKALKATVVNLPTRYA